VLVIVASGRTTPPPAPPPQAPPISGYVVGAPDLLLVSILPEPEINREVRVRPDGKISIDLIGDVQDGVELLSQSPLQSRQRSLGSSETPPSTSWSSNRRVNSSRCMAKSFGPELSRSIQIHGYPKRSVAWVERGPLPRAMPFV
jgi:hypothetical protein